MTESATIRLVILLLGVMGLAGMILYGIHPNEATITLPSSAIGALAAVLASTRSTNGGAS